MNIQAKIVKTFPQTEKLKAIVNLTIDDSFAVHGIKIFDSAKGLFVTMPNIKTGEKRKDIFHPISKESGEELIQVILETYHEQQNETKQIKQTHCIEHCNSRGFKHRWYHH